MEKIKEYFKAHSYITGIILTLIIFISLIAFNPDTRKGLSSVLASASNSLDASSGITKPITTPTPHITLSPIPTESIIPTPNKSITPTASIKPTNSSVLGISTKTQNPTSTTIPIAQNKCSVEGVTSLNQALNTARSNIEFIRNDNQKQISLCVIRTDEMFESDIARCEDKLDELGASWVWGCIERAQRTQLDQTKQCSITHESPQTAQNIKLVEQQKLADQIQAQLIQCVSQ